jgi:hypothetical protein
MFFPDCGLGGPQNPGGPCTGTYGPGDAGGHVFDGISAAPVTTSLLAAGVLLAGLIFVVWIVSKVGRFFGRDDSEDADFSDDALRDRHSGPTVEWRFSDDVDGDARGDGDSRDPGERLALTHDPRSS